MQLQNFYAQDVNGNIVPGAICSLFLPGTTTPGIGLGNRSAIFCVANDNTEDNFGEDLLISGSIVTGPWGRIRGMAA